MLARRKVHLDGKLVTFGKANVHIMSHSFSRGSAIFEVMSVHETPKGPAVFRLADHIDRLCRSAEAVRMALPYSKKKFKDAVKETILASKVEKGMVKLICYYGGVEFEVIPRNPIVSVAVIAVDVDKDLGAERFKKSERKPASAMVSDRRKVSPMAAPVECKSAASYLGGTIAKIEAVGKGFSSPILLDENGAVAEGPTESIFIVKDGTLITPQLGHILPGITRDTILTVARDYGVDVEERDVMPEELYEADEAFFTSSIVKTWPIYKIDDTEIPAPGEVTRLLDKIIDKVLDGKVKAYKKWLAQVGWRLA